MTNLVHLIEYLQEVKAVVDKPLKVKKDNFHRNVDATLYGGLLGATGISVGALPAAILTKKMKNKKKAGKIIQAAALTGLGLGTGVGAYLGGKYGEGAGYSKNENIARKSMVDYINKVRELKMSQMNEVEVFSTRQEKIIRPITGGISGTMVAAVSTLPVAVIYRRKLEKEVKKKYGGQIPKEEKYRINKKINSLMGKMMVGGAALGVGVGYNSARKKEKYLKGLELEANKVYRGGLKRARPSNHTIDPNRNLLSNDKKS